MPRFVGAALAAVVGFSVLAGSGGATTPGANGRIAFSHPVRAPHTTFAISTVNPDGSGLRQLTHPADSVLDDQPDFAPSGRLIAFERCGVRCAIFVIRPDGSGLHRLPGGCAHRPPACEDRTAPAWSPDGRRIAFVRSWGAVRHGEIEHSALMVMRADGRRARVLRRIRAFGGDFERPAWSPDGRRLAVAVASPAGRPYRRVLYEIGANGSGFHALTAPALRAGDHPDFSPDGSVVLVGAGARGAHDRGSELYAIPSAGGAPRRLTVSGPRGQVSSGSFSPDGSQVAFAQVRPGESFLTSLYVMAADGTGAHEIVPLAAAEHPDWGPAAQ